VPARRSPIGGSGQAGSCTPEPARRSLRAAPSASRADS
jgi:hypothetical protein